MVFHNDLTANEAQKWARELVPQASTVYMETVGYAGWADPEYQGKIAYVRTTKDMALPPVHQEAILRETGIKCVQKTLESGHNPFLSMPRETADLIIALIEDFTIT